MRRLIIQDFVLIDDNDEGVYDKMQISVQDEAGETQVKNVPLSLTTRTLMEKLREAVISVPGTEHTSDKFSNQLFVDMNGNDTTGDGSVENPYKTIQKAHDVAPSCSAIYIGNGFYEESLNITKTLLTFKGQGLLTAIKGEMTIVPVDNDPVLFHDLNLFNEGTDALTTVTINGGIVNFFHCRFEASAHADSRNFKISGTEQVMLKDCILNIADITPVDVDVINSGSVGAVHSVLDGGVYIDATSTFIHLASIWDIDSSTILGIEERALGLKMIIPMTDEDIEITDNTKGFVLHSATKTWRIKVNDSGALSTEEIV